MDFSEVLKGFLELWQNKPGAVLLLLLGFIVFVFVVVDTWRHRRYRKKPR